MRDRRQTAHVSRTFRLSVFSKSVSRSCFASWKNTIIHRQIITVSKISRWIRHVLIERDFAV
ncbi:MAG: hypothetical protein QOK44_4624, partial [Betaproteobacteria bacterium]|nr:hypothetical protein [Betaproteobacteria bacterium]